MVRFWQPRKYAPSSKNISQSYSSMKFEQFDEASFRGQTQDAFTTIEFGYSPFIPMSKDYIMDFYGVGDGRALTAADVKEEANWVKTLDHWQMDNDINLGEYIENDMNSDIGGEIQSEARRVGLLLSELLEQEGIAKEYSTSHRGEVEEQAVSRYLIEDKKLREQLGLPPDEFITETLGPSPETFDIYNKDEYTRAALEGSLKVMSELIHPKMNIKNIMAGESTNMTTQKYYQQEFMKIYKQGSSVEKAWAASVSGSFQKIIKKWNMIDKDLMSIYAKIPDAPEGDGPDTIEYTARQMISRFIDIYNDTPGLGKGYFVQAPLPGAKGHYSGYAIIRPHVVGGKLKGVDYSDTGIAGGPEFVEFIKAVAKEGDLKASDFAFGTRHSYATNAQLIAFWAYQNTDLTIKEALTVMEKASVDWAYADALRGGRQDLLTSALQDTIQVGMGRYLGNLANVSVVETLTSVEASEILQEQIKAFFEDEGVERELIQFYKNAQEGSGELTKAWKGSVPGTKGPITEYKSADLTVQPFGVGEVAPYTTQKKMAGVGMPFWLTFGRSQAAFKLFKSRESRKIKEYAKKGLKVPKDYMIRKMSPFKVKQLKKKKQSFGAFLKKARSNR